MFKELIHCHFARYVGRHANPKEILEDKRLHGFAVRVDCYHHGRIRNRVA